VSPQKWDYEDESNTVHTMPKQKTITRSKGVIAGIVLLTVLILQSAFSMPNITFAAGSSRLAKQRATLPPEWTATFTASPPAQTAVPLPTITLGGISRPTIPAISADTLNTPIPSAAIQTISEITGKQVIIDIDALSIHTGSDGSDPVIENAPRGAIKTILVEAVNVSAKQIWWYIADGYGWIPKEINGVPTVRDYTPDALNQMLQGMDDEMRSDRGNPRLHLQKGWMYYGQKNYGGAISEITIAIGMMEEAGTNNGKEYGRLYDYRGKVYLDMNDNINAIKNFTEAINFGFKEASVYNRRALAYQKSGQYPEAEVDYDEAVKLNPQYGLLYSNQGTLVDDFQADDPAQLDYYAKAIETDMYFPYSYTNRARYYRHKGDFGDHMINDYTMALSLLPHDKDIRNNRGIAYSVRQQYQLALQDFELVIQEYPDYADPYTNMGIVYANMGENQAAVDSLLKAIKLDDPKGAAYYNLGLILQRDNQYEAAIYCYNKALQLNPERRDAQLNRAQIYEMLGGLDESKIMANPSVESLILPID